MTHGVSWRRHSRYLLDVLTTENVVAVAAGAMPTTALLGQVKCNAFTC